MVTGGQMVKSCLRITPFKIVVDSRDEKKLKRGLFNFINISNYGHMG